MNRSPFLSFSAAGLCGAGWQKYSVCLGLEERKDSGHCDRTFRQGRLLCVLCTCLHFCMCVVYWLSVYVSIQCVCVLTFCVIEEMFVCYWLGCLSDLRYILGSLSAEPAGELWGKAHKGELHNNNTVCSVLSSQSIHYLWAKFKNNICGAINVEMGYPDPVQPASVYSRYLTCNRFTVVVKSCFWNNLINNMTCCQWSK